MKVPFHSIRAFALTLGTLGIMLTVLTLLASDQTSQIPQIQNLQKAAENEPNPCPAYSEKVKKVGPLLEAVIQEPPPPLEEQFPRPAAAAKALALLKERPGVSPLRREIIRKVKTLSDAEWSQLPLQFYRGYYLGGHHTCESLQQFLWLRALMLQPRIPSTRLKLSQAQEKILMTEFRRFVYDSTDPDSAQNFGIAASIALVKSGLESGFLKPSKSELSQILEKLDEIQKRFFEIRKRFSGRPLVDLRNMTWPERAKVRWWTWTKNDEAIEIFFYKYPGSGSLQNEIRALSESAVEFRAFLKSTGLAVL